MTDSKGRLEEYVHSQRAGHVKSIAVKAHSQLRVLLGEHTLSEVPRGYLLEYPGQITEEDKLTSEVVILEVKNKQRLILIAENFSDRTITANIRQFY